MDSVNYLTESFKLLSENKFDLGKLPELTIKSKNDIIIENEVMETFREREFISRTKDILSNEYLLEDIIEKLLELVAKDMNTSRIGVAYIDYEKNTIFAEHGAFDYGKVLLGPGFSVDINSTSLKEIIASKEGRITPSLIKELEEKPYSPSLKLLIEEGIRSNLIMPLIKDETVFGMLFFSSLKENNYNEKDLDLGIKIAQEISILLNTTHLIKKMFITMTNAFASLVEKRDDETGAHLTRMTQYSKLIAEELVFYDRPGYRIKQSFVSDIENYAAVHDIGKIGIPDSILKKPGKLTEIEREVMKTHTTIGGKVIRDIRDDLNVFNKEFFKVALEITEGHHERWDGGGYPKGLKGDQIPLAARIVAIADVFDALTSKRVYKDDFGFEKSVEIINEEAGKHFDPELVKIFNKVLPEIRIVYENKED